MKVKFYRLEWSSPLRLLKMPLTLSFLVTVLSLNLYLISLTKYYNQNRNHYGETAAIYTGLFLFYSSTFWNENAVLRDNSYSECK